MSFATDLLDALAPMLYADATNGNALDTYLTGLALPFELIETWVSDTTDDHVGWSLLVDVDRCPVEALPWLGQFVGVKVDQRLDEADQRSQIRNLDTWKRGTPQALINAALPFLTGTKTVVVRERYDGTANDAPYAIEVDTIFGETADDVVVEAAIRAQKAAGLTLVYVSLAGQTLQNIKDNFATLTTVKNTFATLKGVKSNQAGV